MRTGTESLKPCISEGFQIILAVMNKIEIPYPKFKSLIVYDHN